MLEDAAGALGLPKERASTLRAYHLPLFDRLGYALHLYFDLQGLSHGLAHNSNATQASMMRVPWQDFGARTASQSSCFANVPLTILSACCYSCS